MALLKRFSISVLLPLLVLLFYATTLRQAPTVAQQEQTYKYAIRVVYFPPNSTLNNKPADGWFNVCPIMDDEAHESSSFCTNDYYSKTFTLADLGLEATWHYTAAESFEHMQQDVLYLWQTFILDNGSQLYQRGCKLEDDPNLLFQGSVPTLENYLPYPNTCLPITNQPEDLNLGATFKTISQYIYPTRTSIPPGTIPAFKHFLPVILGGSKTQPVANDGWSWKLRQTLIKDTDFLVAQYRDCNVTTAGVDWSGCLNAWQFITDTAAVGYSANTEYHFLGLPSQLLRLSNTPSVFHRQSVSFKTTIEGDSFKTHACDVDPADGAFDLSCPFGAVPNVFNFPPVIAYDAYILTVKTPLLVALRNGTFDTPVKPSPQCGAPVPLPCNYPYY